MAKKEDLSSQEPLQPIEKQEQAHADAIAPLPVLQPGRPFVASNDLIGELMQLLHEAEKAGQHAVAAELHNCMVKVGDLVSHLTNLEKNAVAHLKPVYKKVIAFFRK